MFTKDEHGMINEQELNMITQAATKLRQETGFEVKELTDDRESSRNYRLIIHNDFQKWQFFIEAKPLISNAEILQLARQAPGANDFLVIADHITQGARTKLEEQGISWLETNGNAKIKSGSLAIAINGNKPLNRPKPLRNRAFTATGLKVVFYLLRYPNAINSSLRNIAAKTAVSLGNVKYIVDGLLEAKYIIRLNDKKVKLVNRSQLLNRWVAGYGELLRPTLNMGRFRFLREKDYNEWKSVPVEKNETVWGGEAGAELLDNYLKARLLTMYTDRTSRFLMPVLKIVPDEDGDIELITRFWIAEENGERIAPELLIYADLILSADPRCKEAAERIYQSIIMNELERS